ncbi:hypothetical protein COLO4_04253 [Corchorus olitorius]|uniref:Uncharacterized protein n=1 Tax=Corchorus olitorius TaxID=93759 RepID=A0A1R3KUN2_9ROSI|nr:hypothetical protein COLO4_04253 [Corchorus olitorius]
MACCESEDIRESSIKRRFEQVCDIEWKKRETTEIESRLIQPEIAFPVLNSADHNKELRERKKTTDNNLPEVVLPLLNSAHNKQPSKDFVVVTILVAVDAACNLPRIRSTNDVKKALNCSRDICSTSNSDKIIDVQVYLTPQQETRSLSKEALLETYTHLRLIDETHSSYKALASKKTLINRWLL